MVFVLSADTVARHWGKEIDWYAYDLPGATGARASTRCWEWAPVDYCALRLSTARRRGEVGPGPITAELALNPLRQKFIKLRPIEV